MIDPIAATVARAFQGGTSALGAGGQDTGARTVPVLADPEASSFTDTLTRAISDVSARQDDAASTIQAYLRGDDIELHRVMAATEEAQIALEVFVEMRNKFTEAYRTLTSMQG